MLSIKREGLLLLSQKKFEKLSAEEHILRKPFTSNWRHVAWNDRIVTLLVVDFRNGIDIFAVVLQDFLVLGLDIQTRDIQSKTLRYIASR